MDRLTLRAAFAAVLSCLALTACGGGSSSNAAAPAPVAAPQAVTGVATPNAVSVVTAKNAN